MDVTDVGTMCIFESDFFISLSKQPYRKFTEAAYNCILSAAFTQVEADNVVIS